MTFPPGILARGPWQRGQVAVSWHEDAFEPDADQNAAADRAIAELEDRGSPAHDGLAARLCGFHADEALLRLDLQPTRWSLRLGEDAANSLSVLCVARDAAGRWLAGRRAPWVATWAGRWALGAGGSVEVGENPVEALTRELEEEWSVRPERLTVEALVALPSGLAMLVGQAWLADGVEVERDAEHDDHHKHSRYLILNAGLPGFSPRETVLIGQIARYHRKGIPGLGPFASLAEDGDVDLVTRCATVLRLAEELERSRDQAVDHVSVQLADGVARLRLDAHEDVSVARWAAQREAELFRRAFGRELEVSEARRARTRA